MKHFIDAEHLVKNKYNHLLTALIVLFLFSPKFEVRDPSPGFPLVVIIFSVVLFAALRTTMQKGKLFRFLSSIIAVNLALNIFLYYLPADHDFVKPLQTTNSLITILFYLSTIFFLSRELFRVREVTPDTIKGGICAYILIGFTWANIYALVIKHDPTSFLLTNISETDPEIILSKMMYVHFSFTTLTTLGYGDIVPNNHTAAIIANSEAIIGQLYLTIFVARLVGLYIAEEMRQDQKDIHT